MTTGRHVHSCKSLALCECGSSAADPTAANVLIITHNIYNRLFLCLPSWADEYHQLSALSISGTSDKLPELHPRKIMTAVAVAMQTRSVVVDGQPPHGFKQSRQMLRPVKVGYIHHHIRHWTGKDDMKLSAQLCSSEFASHDDNDDANVIETSESLWRLRKQNIYRVDVIPNVQPKMSKYQTQITITST